MSVETCGLIYMEYLIVIIFTLGTKQPQGRRGRVKLMCEKYQIFLNFYKS